MVSLRVRDCLGDRAHFLTPAPPRDHNFGPRFEDRNWDRLVAQELKNGRDLRARARGARRAKNGPFLVTQDRQNAKNRHFGDFWHFADPASPKMGHFGQNDQKWPIFCWPNLVKKWVIF